MEFMDFLQNEKKITILILEEFLIFSQLHIDYKKTKEMYFWDKKMRCIEMYFASLAVKL